MTDPNQPGSWATPPDPWAPPPPQEPPAASAMQLNDTTPAPGPGAAAALPPAPPTGPGAPSSPSPVGFAWPVSTVSPRRGPRISRGRLASIVLVPFIAIMVFFAGAAADRSGLLGPTVGASTGGPTASGADIDLIREAWDAIHRNYVDAGHLDDKALAYGAIRGLADAVGDDGHTSFLTADEAKAVDQSLSGSFVGIGIQVDGTSGRFVVADVIPGTPADEAGLERGDTITAVDGRAVDGRSEDSVISSIRGPEGEPVVLTIDRAGRDKPFDVRIVRRKFELPLVGWTMVPGRTVALIRLEQFSTGAGKAVKDAIAKAKDAGATAIILDLRANPGGYVNEAVAVASQFVGDGTVYQSIDASGKEKDVPVEPGGLWTDGPLVVLADGDTASSAEIVTGAIQDAKRGTVVGEKTFGTGTVLGRFDLSDGSSLRIGVERWLTRAGRPIWHEGLLPDVQVALGTDVTRLRPSDVGRLTPAQLAASDDAQLLKALELLKGKG